MKRIMKRILILCLLLSSSIASFAQTDYHWFQNQKIYLKKNPKKKYLLLSSAINSSKGLIEKSGNPSLKVQRFEKMNIFSNYHKNKKDSFPLETWWAIVDSFGNTNFNDNANVLYEAPVFITENNEDMPLSNFFTVRLKSEKDTSELKNFASKNKVQIVGNTALGSLSYLLSCTKHSKGNALEMANMFYESGIFEYTDPDLMYGNVNTTCTKNDTYFDSQWGLQNTLGQIGTNNTSIRPDIKVCDAWQITTGSDNIIVAVIDRGIELDHPDLTNMHPVSYDANSKTTPSKIYGEHGTACAGIIGADIDNNLGIAGISPKCPLMSISSDFISSPTSNLARAEALSFAWQNGASVISNSWNAAQNNDIENEINNALTQGRNGLGCVVVFASGNTNSTVEYPANYNADIIVVGAISPCGERGKNGTCDGTQWLGPGNFPTGGSCYGAQLDIMAPGVKIPTTDLTGDEGYNYSNVSGENNYYLNFDKTSSAAPHVAAVAALILSVNPYLTQKQVADIIETTAQKINPPVYTYQTTTGRPNGTWNNEMGYGVLDAGAAVTAAKNLCTVNSADLYMKDKYNDFGTESNPDADEVYWDSKDIWVRRQNDGFTNQSHQNPEYRPVSFGVPNYVYVKVRNRGCAASTGTDNKLKLYWAKASTALDWPAPWDGSKNTSSIKWGNLIATKTISSITAGDYTIFEYEWYPPDIAIYSGINSEPWHFCLLARIETSSASPYGMTYPETNCLWCNVKDNNNIVWRNITVIDSAAGAGSPPPPGGNGGKGSVMVKNLNTSSNSTIKLRFSVPGEELNNSVLHHCTIKINLGNSLTQEWIAGGMQGAGIAFGSDSVITILNENAWIGNMIIQPEEEHFITVHVTSTQLPLPEEQRNTYLFDIIQFDNDTIRGGERFEVVLDFEQTSSETAISTSINNKLPLSHFTDVSIYPNPADEKLFISTKTDAVYEVVITDLLGKTLYENKFQKNLSINVSAIPKGIYFVRSLNTSENSLSISKVIIQ